MFAPVCGCSTMSLRSIDLKRPLRERSALTTWATSNESAAASAAVNGTIAMGIASSCPFVTSTTNSPQLRGASSIKRTAAAAKLALFIGLELNFEIPLEQRRIRRVRQRRGFIHCDLDGLADRRISIALGDMGIGDIAARYLSHCDAAIYADPRRARLDPGVLDGIAQARNVAVAQGTRLHRPHVLFLGDLPAQFGFVFAARALFGRPLGVRDLLGLCRLPGLCGLLGEDRLLGLGLRPGPLLFGRLRLRGFLGLCRFLCLLDRLGL